MSLPRYPKYKDSGVEWLGEVPEHWEVRKLLNLARLESGHTPSRQHPEYWVESECVIPWFTLADVGFLRDEKNTSIETTSQKISELGMANSAARMLPPGTVILSRTASVGFSGITSIPLAVSQDFAAWICGERIQPRFLLLCLRAMKQEFKRLMMGSTHQTIYMPDIEAFKVPVPGLPEQARIVRFVDHESAKIDGLIAEQQRLMALLKEKRQAVISHAVTRGLNPDAPMKPSGIVWLGDVPAHWDARKLLDLARLESGHTPSRQHPEWWIEEECVIPWFTLADVSFLRDPRNWLIETTSQKISEIGLENSAARRLPVGSVLLSRTASVGFSGMTGVVLAVSQDFAAWVCGPKIRPTYLLFCLRAMTQEFDRLKMGSTHQTIYMPDIEAFRVPVPPVAEQAMVEEHIMRETEKLDALSAEAQRAIDLLQERRTALISAAVTGQIDVRNLV